MPEVALFEGGNPLVNSDLFKSLLDTTEKLAGSGGTNRRISIKGNKFRKIVNGEQMEVSKSDTMNIVIVDAAAIGRTYYEGQYDPDKSSPPVCWSHDTDQPSPDVKHPQSKRCAECPQNVKGSGQGDSRACRYSQRLAVVLEGDLESVYQLSLPATSLFGEGKGKHLPMQGYARFLKEHKTPVIAVVTEMQLDEDSEVPKLAFKPVRPLDEEELNKVVALRDSQAVKRAIEFTVSQQDGVQEPPEVPEEEAPKPKKAKKEAKVDDSDDDVDEPSVVKKGKAEAPKPDNDLAGLIEDWDDE